MPKQVSNWADEFPELYEPGLSQSVVSEKTPTTNPSKSDWAAEFPEFYEPTALSPIQKTEKLQGLKREFGAGATREWDDPTISYYAKMVRNMHPLVTPILNNKYGDRYAQHAASVVAGLSSGLLSMEPAVESFFGKETPVAKKIKSVVEEIDEIQKNVQVKDPTFVDHLVSGALSGAAFMIPGLGVVRGIEGLAAASSVAARLAPVIGQSAMTIFESAIEAGSVYNESRKTLGDKEAANRAAAALVGNIGLLAITNKAARYFEGGRTLLRSALRAAPMEGLQESGQKIISDVVQGKPVDWKATILEGTIGGIVGAGMGPVSSGLEVAEKGFTKISPSDMAPADIQNIQTELPVLAGEIVGKDIPETKEKILQGIDHAISTKNVALKTGMDQDNAQLIATKAFFDFMSPESITEPTTQETPVAPGIIQTRQELAQAIGVQPYQMPYQQYKQVYGNNRDEALVQEEFARSAKQAYEAGLDVPQSVMQEANALPESVKDMVLKSPVSRYGMPEQELVNKAFERFGETKNLETAGFLLPDGKMLDFEDKKAAVPGIRLEHRTIGEIYGERDYKKDDEQLNDFIGSTKAARIVFYNNAESGKNLSIQASGPLSQDQVRVIRDYLAENSIAQSNLERIDSFGIRLRGERVLNPEIEDIVKFFNGTTQLLEKGKPYQSPTVQPDLFGKKETVVPGAKPKKVTPDQLNLFSGPRFEVPKPVAPIGPELTQGQTEQLDFNFSKSPELQKAFGDKETHKRAFQEQFSVPTDYKGDLSKLIQRAELAKEVQERGIAPIPRRKIKHLFELGDLLAVGGRSPAYEIMRIVYLNENKEVLFDEALTYGMPDILFIDENLKLHISEKMKALKARYFVLSHNHPGGDPTPSGDRGDMWLHGHIKEVFGDQYYGHIVHNSTEFCGILNDAENSIVRVPYKMAQENFAFDAAQSSITSPMKLASYIRSKMNGDTPVIIYLDNQNRVDGFEFLDPNQPDFIKTVENRMKGFRARSYAIGLPKSYKSLMTNKFLSIVPRGTLDIVLIDEGNFESLLDSIGPYNWELIENRKGIPWIAGKPSYQEMLEKKDSLNLVAMREISDYGDAIEPENVDDSKISFDPAEFENNAVAPGTSPNETINVADAAEPVSPKAYTKKEVKEYAKSLAAKAYQDYLAEKASDWLFGIKIRITEDLLKNNDYSSIPAINKRIFFRKARHYQAIDEVADSLNMSSDDLFMAIREWKPIRKPPTDWESYISEAEHEIREAGGTFRSRRPKNAPAPESAPTDTNAMRTINRNLGITKPEEEKVYSDRQALRRSLQMQSMASAQAENEIANRLLNIKLQAADIVRSTLPDTEQGAFLDDIAKIFKAEQFSNLIDRVIKRFEAVEAKMGRDKAKAGMEAKKANLARLKELQSVSTRAAKFAEDELQKIKTEVAAIIKERLPLAVQGRFIVALRDAKRIRHIQKISDRIDEAAQKSEKRVLIESIKADLKKIYASKSIALDYQELIQGLMNDYLLAKPMQQTLNRVQALAEFLERKKAAGEDVRLPGYVYESLRKLTAKPLADLTTGELADLANEINLLAELGRVKFRVKAELDALRKERDLNDIAASARPINRRSIVYPIHPGEKLGIGREWINRYRKARNSALVTRFALTPMDVLFDMLDGFKMYTGPIYRIFKARIDLQWNKYLQARDSIRSQTVDLAKKLDLNRENFERIGVYAIDQQETGREKLLNNGLTNEEIEAIVLTDKENQFYKYMRGKLDALLPNIREVMRDLYNTPVESVRSYFPFVTNWEMMDGMELSERMDQDIRGLKKNAPAGFTKSRIGAGSQKVNIDSLEVFLRHVDDVAYLLTVGRETKYLGELANSKQFGETVGDIGQKLIREWVDVLARKGAAGDVARSHVVDVLRRNLGRAQFSFKLSTALIQLTPLGDGAALIGKDAFDGAALMSDRKWRKFVRDNFPEIRDRIGDDQAFLDFEGPGLADKITRIGLYPMTRLDLLAASSVGIGAYRKYMRENGLEIDLDKPNKEAIAYAQLIVRRSQASAQFKDAPLALTSGRHLTGNISLNRALLQFSNFAINQWSLLTHELWDAGIKKGRTKQSANIFAWMLLTAGAQVGLMRGNQLILNAIAQALTGDEPPEKKDSFLKDYSQEMIARIPFVGYIASSLMYDRVPVPVVNAIWQGLSAGIEPLMFGKRPETKTRGAIRAAAALGKVSGLFGTAQVEQLALKAVPYNRRKKIKLPSNS